MKSFPSPNMRSIRKFSGAAISGARPYLLLLIAAFIAVAIFRKSQLMPSTYQWTIASGMMVLSFTSFMLLNQLEGYKGILRSSVGLALGIGFLLLPTMPLPKVKVETFTATRPDHTNAPGAHLTPIAAWGQAVDGYTLHPAFPGSTTANALAITLAPMATFGTVLVTQPISSLQNNNGTPTNGDGIRLTAKIFNENGIINDPQVFTLSQADFLARKWVELPLWRNKSVTRLELVVDSGPEGSTSAYDTTHIGLQVHSLDGYSNKLSNLLLLTLSLFTVIFTGGYALKHVLFHEIQRKKIASFGVQYLIAGVILIGYVFWQQTQSHFAYYWDYLNYWSKTETLFSMMQAQQWTKALGWVVTSLPENYSALPAVPMVMLTWLRGAADRVSYALTLSLVYTLPTYFAVVFLAKRIIDVTQKAPSKPLFRWDISVLCLVAVYPSYFGTTLLLMPDIGGVLLMALAMLVAIDILSSIENGGQLRHPASDMGNIVAGSLVLGTLFAISFLFRRWYVFAFAGIFGAMACLVAVDFLRLKGRRWSIVAYSTSAAILALFSALSMLCWILFSWLAEAEKHDYAALYASYNFGIMHAANSLIQSFGLIPLTLALAGLLSKLKSKRSDVSIWLLIISAIISAALFLSVQTPGHHHFYLLMPVFCVGSLLAFWTAVDRWGHLISAALVGVILIGGLLDVRVLTYRLFPDYKEVMPKQQLHGESMKEIAAWLNSPGVQHQPFCVIASSAVINQSMVANLWQIYPALERRTFSKRLVWISEVDSADGPPNASIRACNIFLVADPFQHTVARASQFNVELLQRELLSGNGLGEDVDRTPAREWALGADIRVIAYKRIRPTTEARYEELVERYRIGKASNLTAGQ